MTGTGELVGTPGYLAPERVMGAPATAASDLYSLGIVAYECLAGAPPFTGLALAVALAHRERPLPPLPGQVPAEVAALVLELTAKDPAARPHSAGEVAARAGELAGRLSAGASVRAGCPVRRSGRHRGGQRAVPGGRAGAGHRRRPQRLTTTAGAGAPGEGPQHRPRRRTGPGPSCPALPRRLLVVVPRS